MITSDQNIGAIRNGLRTSKACRGKYVAYCEGDDFWNDPLKLQKQADLLEQHPACSGCFTDCFIIEESKPTRIARAKITKNNLYTLRDIIVHRPPAMCHWIIRKSIIDDLPEWFLSLKLGFHTALLIYTVEHGDCLHIPEPTATYRIHPGGITSGKDRITMQKIALYNLLIMRQHFNSKVRKILEKRIARNYLTLSFIYTSAAVVSEAISAIKDGLKMSTMFLLREKAFYRLLYRICILKLKSGRKDSII